MLRKLINVLLGTMALACAPVFAANVKISALPTITGVSLAGADLVAVVDTDLATTKSISVTELKSALATNGNPLTVDDLGLYFGNRVSGTYVGVNAGLAQTSAADNITAIGFQALASLTTGDNNTAIGTNTLKAVTTSSSNTAIGSNTLPVTTGAGNTVVGQSSMSSLLTGNNNTAIGNGVMAQNVSSSSNTCVGFFCMSMTTGSQNTCIGGECLNNNTSGTQNTAVGFDSGYNGIASRALYLGREAGYNNTQSDALYIGNASNFSVITGNMSIAQPAVTVNGKLNATLGLGLSTTTSKPTCTAAYRGFFWHTEGGAGVADVLEICQKSALDAYAWIPK